MSYIINDDADQRGPRRGRSRMWLLGLGVVVVAVLVAAFLIGRGGRTDGAAPVPVSPVGEPAITWTKVGTQPVPNSALHGPTQTINGLAAGFSHDKLGAVLAAINISARLTGDAGPAVYETTARQQCTGDIDATISTIRDQSTTAVAGTTIADEYLYRITSGDPSGDLVAVSIAGSSLQSRDLGGYAELTRTLQWVEGDWKLQVPPSPPQLVSSVAGYASLGRTHA